MLTRLLRQFLRHGCYQEHVTRHSCCSNAVVVLWSMLLHSPDRQSSVNAIAWRKRGAENAPDAWMLGSLTRPCAKFNSYHMMKPLRTFAGSTHKSVLVSVSFRLSRATLSGILGGWSAKTRCFEFVQLAQQRISSPADLPNQLAKLAEWLVH